MYLISPLVMYLFNGDSRDEEGEEEEEAGSLAGVV